VRGSQKRQKIIAVLHSTIDHKSINGFTEEDWCTKKRGRKLLIYSQTLENKSSFPPNPPAVLPPLELFCFVVDVVVRDGAALVHPPKSSSGATVGVGLLAGAPHPAPMSLAVRVSGTLIAMLAED